MFDMLEPAIMEGLQEKFGILDEGYIGDMGKEFIDELQITFDERFDVRFFAVDDRTEQPVWPYVFRDRKQVESAVELHKDKEHLSVAVVLLEK